MRCRRSAAVRWICSRARDGPDSPPEMTKRLPLIAGVLFQAAPHPRARPFRSDPLVDRTNCFPEEKMSHVFPRTAAASPHISNTPRELQFPKYCGARSGENAPPRSPSLRESNREGWARARRHGCRLRRAIPKDVEFPGLALLLPNLRAIPPTCSAHYSRSLGGRSLRFQHGGRTEGQMRLQLRPAVLTQTFQPRQEHTT
jgi:hypothetical protein